MRKLRHNLFQVSDRADIENINSLIPEISKINLYLLFSLFCVFASFIFSSESFRSYGEIV